ncbi:hypothetical protein GOP47_0002681 [Adiantum capillus-veneris]|uniref:Proteasome maturation factor UMP1 n=1 Tax=Adiantum capillus-veneris TaxID=13818 RepID=A0A9D4VC93_ADICA|nr:hypothetical protein GOP47_0002681 [Adiantum capillus-veneris]
MAMNEETGTSLPFNPTHPHETLRHGLTSFKQEAVPAHPVEIVQSNSEKHHRQTQRSLLERAYGSAVPLRMDIDRQILSRFQRPPGLLPSSMLGLHSLTGELDEFGFEDFLNDPQISESLVPMDMHLRMEAQLGLSKGPAARTFL